MNKKLENQEIYELLMFGEGEDNLFLTDDDGIGFELEQLGMIPLHGVHYAILNLLKIEGKEVSDAEAGLVILELDYDEEVDEYFVSTVEDDDLFADIINEFNILPTEENEKIS